MRRAWLLTAGVLAVVGALAWPDDPADAARSKRERKSKKKPAVVERFNPRVERYVETIAGLNIEFVRVPGGTFYPGKLEGEGDYEVTLDDYWISRYEITVGQWKKFLEESQLEFEWSKNSWGEHPVKQYSPTDSHPIINVGWTHAQGFTQWLSMQSENEFNLPTEAQWEYAARGGRNFMYATPNGQIDTAQIHCNDCRSGFPANKTIEVGTFEPNPFGVHEMSGNVWEWCRDYGGKDFPKGKFSNPAGPEEGEVRQCRGGSFNNGPGEIRTIRRGSIKPGYISMYVGFRIVLENYNPPKPPPADTAPAPASPETTK